MMGETVIQQKVIQEGVLQKGYNNSSYMLLISKETELDNSVSSIFGE